MGTKNNPGAFDCYAKAHPDEPMFILLGRDRIGAALVRIWATVRAILKPGDPKIAEAFECADAMTAWCHSLEPRRAPVTTTAILCMLGEADNRDAHHWRVMRSVLATQNNAFISAMDSQLKPNENATESEIDAAVSFAIKELGMPQ